jgi:hypothetical protein
MKSSNVPEKSKGVLLYAFNTNTVDYVKIADQSARLINQTLNLPVTLVTDQPCAVTNMDQIIIVNNDYANVRKGYANLSTWRNGDRYRAAEQSPYTETLLIDSDYLMLDQSLLKLLNTVTDYCIMSKNKTLTKELPARISDTSINQVWATAVVFKKTQKTQQLFDLVGRIQCNYDYYRCLYNIRATNFRNDFAFAIANNIINGYTDSNLIPWPMLTMENPIQDIDIVRNTLVIREQSRAHVIPRQNIHIIDKDYLSSDRFKKLVDTLCQE